MGEIRNEYSILAIKHFKKQPLERVRYKDNMKMPFFLETG
jgi:hypothetical protein